MLHPATAYVSSSILVPTIFQPFFPQYNLNQLLAADLIILLSPYLPVIQIINTDQYQFPEW